MAPYNQGLAALEGLSQLNEIARVQMRFPDGIGAIMQLGKLSKQ